MKKSFLDAKEKILFCMLLYALLLANVAAIRIGVASAETELYVEPSSITDPTLLPPVNFTINIKIANVTSLQGYEVYLHYETTILTGLGVIILQGDHLPSCQSSMNDDVGVVWINVTYEGEPITADTPVKLAKIQFQVVDVGKSILDLYDTKLVDPQSVLIPHGAFDGYFDNRQPSTISIYASPTTIAFGKNTSIGGSITPTCVGVNVTIYYRLTGEVTWNTLTTVPTNATSQYSHVWTPPAIGNYEVKASWQGDSTALPAESFTATITVQDINPPTIGDPSQQPEIPDDGETVTISVDVIDEESGVRNVTLWYCVNGGAWTGVTISRLTGDTYTGEIPGFPAGTNVQYYIIAYDNAGNPRVKDNFGGYYVYTVIPEFPAAIIIPLFIAATLVAVLLAKRVRSRWKNSLSKHDSHPQHPSHIEIATTTLPALFL